MLAYGNRGSDVQFGPLQQPPTQSFNPLSLPPLQQPPTQSFNPLSLPPLQQPPGEVPGTVPAPSLNSGYSAGGTNPQRDGIVQALMDIQNPPPGTAVPGPTPQFAGGMPPQPAAPGMPGMPQGVPGLGTGTMAPPMGAGGPMPGLAGTSPGVVVGGLYGQTPAPMQQPITGRPAY